MNHVVFIRLNFKIRIYLTQIPLIRKYKKEEIPRRLICISDADHGDILDKIMHGYKIYFDIYKVIYGILEDNNK